MKNKIVIPCAILLAILNLSSAFAKDPSASTEAIPTLSLIRTREQAISKGKNRKPAVAIRGILKVGELSFHTIERGGGFVRLRKGEFECVMEQQHNSDGTEKRKVFRIKAEGEMGHHLKSSRGTPAAILIHVGNFPHQLIGCISPGRTKEPDGVGESIAALTDIFKACGGFSEGKKVKLSVKN